MFSDLIDMIFKLVFTANDENGNFIDPQNLNLNF